MQFVDSIHQSFIYLQKITLFFITFILLISMFVMLPLFLFTYLIRIDTEMNNKGKKKERKGKGCGDTRHRRDPGLQHSVLCCFIQTCVWLQCDVADSNAPLSVPALVYDALRVVQPQTLWHHGGIK